MAQNKIKSATDQRKFTIVYNDFLESELLDKHEKLIYISIKKFADNETLRAFPSLKTLHKMTGISIRWIKKSIEHMEQLGVLSVEHRTDEDKGHQSNLYTLFDYAEIWNVGSSNDMNVIADEISEMKLVVQLRAKGYTVTKEKELTSEPGKETNISTYNYQYDTVNTTLNHKQSQYVELYTLEQIKQYFNYSIMLHDYPELEEDINSIISILHNTLNTTKPTIRVGGEDKQSMVVTSKLLKLTYNGIIYAINKFNSVTERISNPTSYMLTILYNAEEQMNLDVSNQVQYDLHHPNE